jgi:serine-type D-Ala-D-Ala carboxypeptidase (penicillin-binding protein 5/6)
MPSSTIKLNTVKSKLIIVKLFTSLLLCLLIVLGLKQAYKFDFKAPIFLSGDAILSGIYNSKSSISIDPKDIKSSLKAESFLIYDLVSDKVIVGSGENDMFPIASISKLMTAYVALSDCSDELNIYLDSLLIASDNEASEKIASKCPNRTDFIYKMNYYAIKNNLKLTFQNPSGLDDEDYNNGVSNWGNAISVAKLINLLNKKNKNILYHTTYEEYQNISNTNKSIQSIPFVIGSKTGYTESAGGNLVTIYDFGPAHRIAIIVFNSTKVDRITDTKKLINIYLNHF